MKRWQKILWVSGCVVAAMLIFVVWYRVHYSMEPARAFEVAGAPSGPSVLIATQGSAFKDAVVAGLVDRLKAHEASVKVVDVAALPGIDATQWNAIVVIHTWEMRKPPAAVKTFIEQSVDKGKLVVLTTSGAGDFKMDGIDALSSASRMDDVPDRVTEMAERVEAVLASNTPH